VGGVVGLDRAAFRLRLAAKRGTRTGFHLFIDIVVRLYFDLYACLGVHPSPIQSIANSSKSHGIGNVSVKRERKQPLHENVCGLL
jgi:hypothetical protein